MPQVIYGLSAFEQTEGDLPEFPVINMYLEQADTEDRVLQSRPGLIDSSEDQGAGPVAQVFQEDGVLSGALLSVSGGNFYDAGVSKGAIAGSGPVSIVGNETGAFITAGAAPYYYDGTTLAVIAFPDSANCIKVAAGASRIIFIRENSGIFYWTDPLEFDVEALDFATAETKADRLLDLIFIDDILVPFGSATVEFWPNTQDSLLPFVPLEGRVFEKGIRATGCAAIVGSSFIWVGDDNVVYANGAAPTPISNPGLEKKIKASTDCSLFRFFIDGTECVALRLDTQTYYWVARTGAWHEMASYGKVNWLPQCYSGGYFGSSEDGKLLEFSNVHTDMGGVLERRYRGGFPINGGSVDLNNIRIRTNPGQTPYLTGEYSEPVIELSISRDAGQSFGNPVTRKLGKQGKYAQDIEWRAQGSVKRPGCVMEFRVTDPVPHRVSGIFVNEAWGGG